MGLCRSLLKIPADNLIQRFIAIRRYEFETPV
jgi:hypothetical protein